MKLFLFLLSFSAIAQDFTITPLEKDVDLSSVEKGIKVRSAEVNVPKTYLSPEERDRIFARFIPKILPTLDQSERDLLYKSLLNYDDPTLRAKYSFLKSTNLEELKNAFH